MKKKIIGIIVDILLIMVVFSATDYVSLNVFHLDSFWIEAGIYIVFYVIAFGSKNGIESLWNRLTSQKQGNSKN